MMFRVKRIVIMLKNIQMQIHFAIDIFFNLKIMVGSDIVMYCV